VKVEVKKYGSHGVTVFFTVGFGIHSGTAAAVRPTTGRREHASNTNNKNQLRMARDRRGTRIEDGFIPRGKNRKIRKKTSEKQKRPKRRPKIIRHTYASTLVVCASLVGTRITIVGKTTAFFSGQPPQGNTSRTVDISTPACTGGMRTGFLS